MTTAGISLREVRDSDLPFFWRHVSDPEAQQVAAVTREYHYDRGRFDSHWTRVRADAEVLTRRC